MSPGDLTQWVWSETGSIVAFVGRGPGPGLGTLLVLVLLSLFVWDIRREEGFWNWSAKGILTWDSWQKQRTRNVKASQQRKQVKLEGQLKRREIKREADKPISPSPTRRSALARTFLS